METVKIGIVGVGNIGSFHMRNVLGGELKNAELVALCDSNPEKIGPYPGTIRGSIQII